MRIRLLVLVAVLSVAFGCYDADEHSARRVVTALRLVRAQTEAFRAAVEVDQEGDGVGEFGFFGELAGVVELRGRSRKVRSSYLVRSLTPTDGIVHRLGYVYTIYLPGDGGAVLSEAGAESIPLA